MAITCCQREVGAAQRIHGVDHHLFGDAAHFGDSASQFVEFLVIGPDGMIDHGVSPSAEAAGDVVLSALVARRSEHLAGLAEFDHLAKIHEGGELRDAAACCML